MNKKVIFVAMVLIAVNCGVLLGVHIVNKAHNKNLTLVAEKQEPKAYYKPPHVYVGDKLLPFREGRPRLFLNEKQQKKEIAILEKENPDYAYVFNQIQDFDEDRLWAKARKVYLSDPQTWKRFPAEAAGPNIFYYEKYDRSIPFRKYEVEVKIPVKTITHKEEKFIVYTWNQRLAGDEVMKHFEWSGKVVSIKEIKE